MLVSSLESSDRPAPEEHVCGVEVVDGVLDEGAEPAADGVLDEGVEPAEAPFDPPLPVPLCWPEFPAE